MHYWNKVLTYAAFQSWDNRVIQLTTRSFYEIEPDPLMPIIVQKENNCSFFSQADYSLMKRFKKIKKHTEKTKRHPYFQIFWIVDVYRDAQG